VYKVRKSFIGFKAARFDRKDGMTEIAIVTLLIPAGAYVAQSPKSYYDKNRASRAKVLDIQSLEGEPVKVARSSYDRMFKYRVGEVVRPEYPFEKNGYLCAPGIHFFRSMKRARGWLTA
jgi:hypothetical protein